MNKIELWVANVIFLIVLMGFGVLGTRSAAGGVVCMVGGVLGVTFGVLKHERMLRALDSETRRG
jgi:hypothetical protein